MKAFVLILALLIVGCDQLTGPDTPDQTYKTSDILPGPPQRPPLPCGWSASDTGWVYDLHADTCNGGQ